MRKHIVVALVVVVLTAVFVVLYNCCCFVCSCWPVAELIFIVVIYT